MNIIINNTSRAKSSANDLINNSKSVGQYIETIQSIEAILDNNWGESQADAIYYKTRLEKEKNFLQASSQCNIQFANGIIEYIDLMEKTSSNNVN